MDVQQTSDGAQYTAPDGPSGAPPTPAMVQIEPAPQGPGFRVKAFANPQTPPMVQQVGSVEELCAFLQQIFGGAPPAAAGAPPPGPPPPGM